MNVNARIHEKNVENSSVPVSNAFLTIQIQFTHQHSPINMVIRQRIMRIKRKPAQMVKSMINYSRNFVKQGRCVSTPTLNVQPSRCNFHNSRTHVHASLGMNSFSASISFEFNFASLIIFISIVFSVTNSITNESIGRY